MSKVYKSADGFTLLEMAIVIMISGLIMGATLSLYKPIQAAQSAAVTKLKFERAMNALSTYALQHNALPCPGPPDAVLPQMPGSAPKTCSEGSGIAAWGIIPYMTLGLTQADALDGSGHYMTYVVAKTLTKPAGRSSTDGPMTALLRGNTASNFCGNSLLSSQNMLSIARPENQITEPNVALAVIAYGYEGFGAYSMNMANASNRLCALGDTQCQASADAKSSCCNSEDCRDDDLLSKSLGTISHERDNAVDHAACPNNGVIHVSDYSTQNGPSHFDDQIAYSLASALIYRLGMAGCSP